MSGCFDSAMIVESSDYLLCAAGTSVAFVSVAENYSDSLGVLLGGCAVGVVHGSCVLSVSEAVLQGSAGLAGAVGHSSGYLRVADGCVDSVGVVLRGAAVSSSVGYVGAVGHSSGSLGAAGCCADAVGDAENSFDPVGAAESCVGSVGVVLRGAAASYSVGFVGAVGHSYCSLGAAGGCADAVGDAENYLDRVVAAGNCFAGFVKDDFVYGGVW